MSDKVQSSLYASMKRARRYIRIALLPHKGGSLPRQLCALLALIAATPPPAHTHNMRTIRTPTYQAQPQQAVSNSVIIVVIIIIVVVVVVIVVVVVVVA